MAATSNSVHMVECCQICLPPVSMFPGCSVSASSSLGASPRPEGRSGPVSFQITAFTLSCQILHVTFKSEVSVAPSNMELSPTSLQSQICLWRIIFLEKDCRDRGPKWGLEHLFMWETLCNMVILRFTGHPAGAWDLVLLWVCPSYPSCGSFFVPFSCTIYFLAGSSFLHQWYFCRYLWFWYAHERSWTHGLSALPPSPLPVLHFILLLWVRHVLPNKHVSSNKAEIISTLI